MKQGTVYQRHTARCPRSDTGQLLEHRCRGTWSYHVDAGRDSKGRRRQVTRGGFASRAEARNALRDLLLAGGDRNVEAHRVTVEAYLNQWLDGKRALRPSTRKSYVEHIRLYLVPHLGHLQLRNLTAGHVDAMINAIAGDEQRHLTAATIQRIHATLRGALNSAVRRRLLAFNPAVHIELPRQVRTTVTVWTAAQLRQFLTAIRGDRLYTLYHLVALTGLRRGEALGLRWVDVDLAKGLLWVRQQVVQVGRVKHIGPPKTDAGHRVMPIDAETAALLRVHRVAQQRELEAWGTASTDLGYVFTREDGALLSPDYVTRHFRRLVTDAGLPPLHFHGLRHTNASLGLAAGVAMKVVSERLGHSAIGVTANLYTHVVPAVAQDAADAIALLVRGEGSASDLPSAH